MLKKILFLLFITHTLTIFLSCQNNTTLNNNIEKTMQEKNISEKDLNNLIPIIITTDKGKEEVYSVIIYTNNSQPLKDKGIIVQSESKNFVTALIKKEDIIILNKINSIKYIKFPEMDTIGVPKQEFQKDE